jgi:sarcosine oxidase gamma subunit
VLAKAEIVLWRRAPRLFHVEVARSYAAYLRAFLQEAACGLPGTPG